MSPSNYPTDFFTRKDDPVIAPEVLFGMDCLLHRLMDLDTIFGMDDFEESFVIQRFIRGEMK